MSCIWIRTHQHYFVVAVTTFVLFGIILSFYTKVWIAAFEFSFVTIFSFYLTTFWTPSKKRKSLLAEDSTRGADAVLQAHSSYSILNNVHILLKVTIIVQVSSLRRPTAHRRVLRPRAVAVPDKQHHVVRRRSRRRWLKTSAPLCLRKSSTKTLTPTMTGPCS